MINTKKDKYKLLTPELYPPLKKKTSHFEMDEDKMKGIGEIAQNLLKMNELSIYRMLRKDNNFFINFVNTEKSLQNRYLKKIVEANNEYFPIELSQDKFQKRSISLEEQMKMKINLIKDKPIKNKQNKKSQNENIGRKESSIDMLIVPDLVELPKRKVFDEKQKDGNSNKVNDVLVEDEDQEEAEEKESENEEEPSYEDDYRMDSEGDNGLSEGDNYSDGGVF